MLSLFDDQLFMINKLSACVLGSSSSGNSTVIWNDKSSILIDCGLGPVYITEQLRELGLRIQDLDGVFITHIHSDHVNEATVRNLHKHCIPLYCPSPIEVHLLKKYRSIADAKKEQFLNVIHKSDVELDTLTIRAFEVPHDSDGGCFGYNVFGDLNGKTKKISVSTDMAEVTESALEHIADSDIIVIESNYDVEMLERSGRPKWLKDRIRVGGHLSNDQCAESILQIMNRSQVLPQMMALAHVSKQCNTNALAYDCTVSAMDKHGMSQTTVCETYPQKPSRTMSIS
jgi:phosphoribosyl 1,2-cyclic phosphodiesterase